MSSLNPGQEDEDEDEERFFRLPLPLAFDHHPHPSTSFFGGSPSAPVFSPQMDIGYDHDFSLLFLDNYSQNPNPPPESTLIISQDECRANEQEGGVGQDYDQQQQQQRKGKEEGTSSSPTSLMKKKKMDHNAKERVRRMQLNASYLALRSILPDSNKPKNKWSAPYIIDRTLDHIPLLEGELEDLKSKKKQVLLELEKADNLRQAEQAQSRERSTLSVSINEVKKGQVIIQICHQRGQADTFSELLHKLECQGMEVLNASVSVPCDDRSCCNIHVQMDGGSVGGEYVAELKEKIVAWLS